MIAFALIGVGILIAAMQDLKHGSIGGGIVAALGTIPGCYGMWKGIQQEGQGSLAASVSAVVLSLAVGAVLIVLRVINWVV